MRGPQLSGGVGQFFQKKGIPLSLGQELRLQFGG